MHALLYAVVRADRLTWFMVAAEGRLLGHGTVRDFAALRGVQVRAGIVEVIVLGLNGSAPYDDWRRAKKLDREQIENLAALCGYRFAYPAEAA